MLLTLLACVADGSPGVGEPDTYAACEPTLTLERDGDAGFAPPGDLPPYERPLGTLLAEDMDGDGDIDLVQQREGALVHLHRNDGTGRFTTETIDLTLPEVINLALADLDGDTRPDLVALYGNLITMRRNTGGLDFPALEGIFAVHDAGSMAFTFGDPDGDNDLDLLWPHMAERTEATSAPAEYWRNDRGDFVFERDLSVDGGAAVQSPLFSDLENDGDLDLLLPNDLVGLTTVWRNDGVVDGALALEEISAALGIRQNLAAMGFDAVDLDGDGLLDRCVSNVGPPLCFTTASGSFVEAGASLGLVPDVAEGRYVTVGWSIEIVDLDNDGWNELVQASGPLVPGTTPEAEVYTDLVWQGLADGTFRDVTDALGFGDLSADVGMVAADFDGDGAWDLALASNLRPPTIYRNRSRCGAWLDVDLLGARKNTLGYGARVEVTSGGRRQVRELHGLRAHGQGPSLVHFGLGDATEAAVRVFWPDGTVTDAGTIEVNRRLLVEHG